MFRNAAEIANGGHGESVAVAVHTGVLVTTKKRLCF